ncbi:MAG: 4-alpha-glucanotransferase, partial [bacterium]|nr:4-alpha-glucanotransferase [bacterium]
MKFKRASGILLHPTSLPGKYGVGDLGPEAYKFVDFLFETGQTLWQVLPIGTPGKGEFPYQAYSVFGCNHLLISIDLLREWGLLMGDDLNEIPEFKPDKVEFQRVIEFKENIFKKAFEHFKNSSWNRDEFNRFRDLNRWWLDDYALFMALKEFNDGKPWFMWDDEIKGREPDAMELYKEELKDSIEHQRFLQYLVYRQWFNLKKYANEKDIKIIGDIPIFVSHDSADVWANKHLFFLDDAGKATVVAGVPPDYFSATGQRWGNPLYRWDRMQEKGF